MYIINYLEGGGRYNTETYLASFEVCKAFTAWGIQTQLDILSVLGKGLRLQD